MTTLSSDIEKFGSMKKEYNSALFSGSLNNEEAANAWEYLGRAAEDTGNDLEEQLFYTDSITLKRRSAFWFEKAGEALSKSAHNLVALSNGCLKQRTKIGQVFSYAAQNLGKAYNYSGRKSLGFSAVESSEHSLNYLPSEDHMTRGFVHKGKGHSFYRLSCEPTLTVDAIMFTRDSCFEHVQAIMEWKLCESTKWERLQEKSCLAAAELRLCYLTGDALYAVHAHDSATRFINAINGQNAQEFPIPLNEAHRVVEEANKILISALHSRARSSSRE